MRGNLWALLAVVMSLIVVLAAGIGMTTGARRGPAQIQFASYSEAGSPEQDIFIEPYNWLDDLPSDFVYPLRPHDPRDDIPSEFIEPRDILRPYVVRPKPIDTLNLNVLAKPLFAADRVTPHDPYKTFPGALGPFPKGDALGLTLREWLAARGSGTYVVNGEQAELGLTFDHLVPNGKYSLWCGYTSSRVPADEVDTACGRADGSQNQFRADVAGNAQLHLSLKALPESTVEAASLLTLIYERDVETWDGEWGGYGLSSHVQLFYRFP